LNSGQNVNQVQKGNIWDRQQEKFSLLTARLSLSLEVQENSFPYFAVLRQNSVMSVFEEYLTLGQWLAEEERLALYKYLLISQKTKYISDGKVLISERSLNTTFASGDLLYRINPNSLSYKTRKLGTEDYTSEIRTLRLTHLDSISRKRLYRFFAQAELDVLRNFPTPSSKQHEERSFGINLYPFYDLNYYSDGRGRISGFFKKIQAKDDELLEKLLAS
jgi:hypothetical protein